MMMMVAAQHGNFGNDVAVIILSGVVMMTTMKAMTLVFIVEDLRLYFSHINPPQDKILFNSSLMPMTTSAALNASFFSASCNKSDYVEVSSRSTNFAFGGHMYIFGNAMAGLFSLAHAVTKINPVRRAMIGLF